MKASPRYDAIRFLVAGGLNTLLTLLVYQVALIWWSERVSYALGWVVGLAYVAIVYPSRVFVGGRKDIVSRVLVVFCYAVTYYVGVLILTKAIDMDIHRRLAIFISLAVTTSLGFILSRFVLRRPR
ncbi:hypothetical protein EUC41_20180 [Achromobacter denitrificans]|uniref:GtrA family protein n=1 Tax=Achromobacter TaxID=222 RepID=UPI00240D25B2|nr:GtrA family protein [Achromobacter denitrificans]WFC68443.1 hypothetical protein EUC41_20180 [Achromobacter denitrificans]